MPRIIVTGHQRSGTSVIAAMLAKAMGTEAVIDLPNSGIHLAACLRGEQGLSEALEEHYPEQRLKRVIKDCHLSWKLQDLAAIYPKALRLYVVRDPREVIRSCCSRLRLTPWEPATLANVEDTWRVCFTDQCMPVLHLAQRWADMTMQALQCDGVRVLRYEDYLLDPAGTVEDIVSRLQTPLPIGRAYETTQGRKTEHQWWAKFYEDHLDEVESIMAEPMKRLHYFTGPLRYAHSRSYISEAEALCLAKWAKASQGDIVEIGTRFAGTTELMAMNYKGTLWTVDNYSNNKTPAHWLYRNFLQKYGRVFPVVGNSAEVGRHWARPVGMLFIDGDHTYQGVRADFNAWAPHVRPGGHILFHDATPGKYISLGGIRYGWAEGVRQMVDEVLQLPQWVEVERADTIVVLRREP